MCNKHCYLVVWLYIVYKQDFELKRTQFEFSIAGLNMQQMYEGLTWKFIFIFLNQIAQKDPKLDILNDGPRYKWPVI